MSENTTNINNKLTVGKATVEPATSTNGNVLFSLQPYIEKEHIADHVFFIHQNKPTIETLDDANAPYSKVLKFTGYNNECTLGEKIPVSAGERIYVEAWYMVPADDTGTAAVNYLGFKRYDKDKKRTRVNDGRTYLVSALTLTVDGNWHKMSGYYTVESSHTPYTEDGETSDGGAIRYLDLTFRLNFSTGTQEINISGLTIKKVNSSYDEGDTAFKGNVSVGTDSPSARLHIVSSDDLTSTNSLLIENDSGKDLFKINNGGEFEFRPNAQNDTVRLYSETVHSDGRYRIMKEANGSAEQMFSIEHYSSRFGLGKGSWSSLNAAVGIAENALYLPKTSSFIIMNTNSTTGPVDSKVNFEISANSDTETHISTKVYSNTGGLESNNFIFSAPNQTFRTGTAVTDGTVDQNIALHLNSDGNVGIGTDSPDVRLHIIGGAAASGSSSFIVENSEDTNSKSLEIFDNRQLQLPAYGSGLMAGASGSTTKVLNVTNTGLVFESAPDLTYILSNGSDATVSDNINFTSITGSITGLAITFITWTCAGLATISGSSGVVLGSNTGDIELKVNTSGDVTLKAGASDKVISKSIFQLHKVASDPTGYGTDDAGSMYFNTTTNKFRGWNGTSWVDLG